MLSHILLSYRKEDTKSLSGRLADYLSNQFGDEAVTVGSAALIQPGDDYVEAIERGVDASSVLVLVIGPQWLSTRWIDNSEDYDVIALRAALATNRKIIPVLAEGAAQPEAGDLPSDLSKLVQRVGLPLTDDNFRAEATVLVEALRRVVPTSGRTAGTAGALVSAPPASVIDLPPQQPPFRAPIREVIGGKERAVFKGIDAASFQHPWDRAATDSLRKLKGFDFLVSKYLEYGFERINYYLNVANSVMVTPTQFRPLYEMLADSCHVLDMPIPEMYVFGNGVVNAYTFGHNRPYIVLYSGLLDHLTEEEVMAVIAHELGHIKCGHVLYTVMARELATILGALSDFGFGLGNLLSLGLRLTLQTAILTWKRRSELSADRAALLVMQDARPCIAMLAKLAGGSVHYATHLDPEQFLEQAKVYREDDTNLDRFYRFMADMQASTHPFPIERAKYLNEWVDSTEYDQILAGNYAQQLKVRGGICPNCNSKIKPQDNFCPVCGRPTGGV